MRATVLMTAVFMLGACMQPPMTNKQEQAANMEGSIVNDVYTSPDKSFRINVPKMLNPFVKKPSLITDSRILEGGFEVDFSVFDLGEAHRFGVRSMSRSGVDVRNEKTTMLCRISESELERWLKQPANTEVILEEEAMLAGQAGLARIYYVESASLLFKKQNDGRTVREPTLIGVMSAIYPDKERIVFVIYQFDMPNHGGHYTIETENGRKHIASEHMNWMKQLAASMQLQ